MGLARVQIQIVAESRFPENINIIMSRSLAQNLKIRTQPFRVSFGSSVDLGSIALSKMNSNLILVSTKLAQRLKLGNQPSIHAHFDVYNLHLRLGPLFGILINTDPDRNQEQFFGLMTRFLEECSMSGHSLGVQVTIIHPNHFDVNHKQVQGWIREKQTWVQTTLPLPDVLYNRIMSRKIEQQDDLQKKLHLLRDRYKIPIFNEQFLDKYQVYEALYQDTQTRTLLPETHLFHIHRLKEMLEKYPLLYLKPNNGSLGNGIIRISQKSDGITYQAPSANGTVTRQFQKLSELSRVLVRRIGTQKYLIQQGLHLIRYEGRNVDFRVLVQKNRQGEWKITSTVGRISNDQNIVSNLAQGGTVRKAADVLVELLDFPNKPSDQDLRNLALSIAEAFEVLANGHYAELGIDLALDQDGKIWLLEINSKPSKTDDTIINPTVTIRPSVTRLLEYVCFLTGLTKTKKIALPISQNYTPFKPRRGRG